MKKKHITSTSKDTIRRLKVLAKEKESVRRKLVITARELKEVHAALEKRVREEMDARAAILNVFQDLKIQEQQTAEAKAKDEALLESIGDGVVAVDKSGMIIMVNRAAATLLGQKATDLINKKLDAIRLYDEKGILIPTNKWPIATTLLTGKPTTLATSYSDKKYGKFFPIAITATPVVLNKNIIGAIGIFRDITREKELDRVKSEFISIASHQLRTPLTSIQWVVERFIKKEQLTPKGKEYLNDIQMSAKRLTELVDLLLNLSRIEAGRVGTIPESLDVVTFIKNFIDETTPLRDKKELRMVFDDHPLSLMVIIDKSAFHNIVQSLISNAIEYTPEGGKISISVKKEGGNFKLGVEDTGIGIPKAEQLHIFEKFIRASNAKLYKTDGIGIGLFIAERAVNLLGGKIWFKSEENKGSSFYVELPLKFQSKEPRTSLVDRSKVSSKSNVENKNIKKHDKK